MSINSALFAGVAGLAANSTALAVISDNIANVNTVGYKRNISDFSTLITETQSASSHSAGGVRANARSLVSQQGLLQTTLSSTDLGISGNGFFVVSTDPTASAVTAPFLYTRAGSFTADDQGFLRNTAGYYLKGWPVQSDGTVNSNPSDLTLLESVNVNQIGGTAEATTTMRIDANLQASLAISAAEATYDATNTANNMASGAVQPDAQFSTQIFDSQGGFRTVTLSLLKSSVNPNEWHAELHVVPATDVDTTFVDGQVATGTIAFTSNGLLDTGASTLPTTLDFLDSGVVPGAGEFAWAAGLGIGAQSIQINLGQPGAAGGFTQFDSPTSLISTQVNGAVFGNLSGVTVSEEGFVIALFDNGIQRQVFQVPVATFINPNGLKQEQGNAYSVTNDSGTFNLKKPGIAGSGRLSSGTLENSTVDLAQEFTGLITTQRAYSASTRIITTADEMLEELIRIKR